MLYRRARKGKQKDTPTGNPVRGRKARPETNHQATAKPNPTSPSKPTKWRNKLDPTTKAPVPITHAPEKDLTKPATTSSTEIWIKVCDKKTCRINIGDRPTPTSSLLDRIAKLWGIPRNILRARRYGRILDNQTIIAHGSIIEISTNGLEGGGKNDDATRPSEIKTLDLAGPNAWTKLINLTQQFPVFRYPASTVGKVKRRLHGVIKNQGSEPEMRLFNNWASVLCMASLEDKEILTAALRKDKDLLYIYYTSAIPSVQRNSNQTDLLSPSKMLEITNNAVVPTIRSLQRRLPTTSNQEVLWKGVLAHDSPSLHKMITAMQDTIPASGIWHLSPTTALTESDPDYGKKGKLTIHGRRLLRRGFSNLYCNSTGAIIVTKRRGIPIGDLTPTPTRDEFWLHDPTVSRRISKASSPYDKANLLRTLLPNTNLPMLTKIIESKAMLVLVHWEDENIGVMDTAKTAIVIDCPSEPKRRPPIIGSRPNRPPLQASLPNPKHPTRIVIQGHSFWRQNSKQFPVQAWTFNKANTLRHRVCVVHMEEVPTLRFI